VRHNWNGGDRLINSAIDEKTTLRLVDEEAIAIVPITQILELLQEIEAGK
jgi:hypothetical protein